MEENVLLARARLIGASQKTTDEKSPILLVPGVGGSVLQQELNGTSPPPHYFCTVVEPFTRVWIRLSLLAPELFDCFAWQVSRAWNGTAWNEKKGIYGKHKMLKILYFFFLKGCLLVQGKG